MLWLTLAPAMHEQLSTDDILWLWTPAELHTSYFIHSMILVLYVACLNSEHQCQVLHVYNMSKNDTDVAHYNFNAYQRILVIFGRDVAHRVH